MVLRRCTLLTALALLSACRAAPRAETSRSAEASTPSPPPTSAHPAEWSYGGEDGPATWGKLHAAYAACSQGRAQSPVDLGSTKVGSTKKLTANYGKTALSLTHTEHVDDIVDNGHTIQITVDRGSTLAVDGVDYHLRQFHFHSPSEHTRDGRQFPLEIHFVHQNEGGEFAVVAVLMEEGAENPNLASIVAHLPAHKGEQSKPAGIELNLGAQLPRDTFATAYEGSLTTPPCTEGVHWFVLRDVVVTASPAQIEALASRIAPNNRPVQAGNGRPFGDAALAVGSAR